MKATAMITGLLGVLFLTPALADPERSDIGVLTRANAKDPHRGWYFTGYRFTRLRVRISGSSHVDELVEGGLHGRRAFLRGSVRKTRRGYRMSARHILVHADPATNTKGLVLVRVELENLTARIGADPKNTQHPARKWLFLRHGDQDLRSTGNTDVARLIEDEVRSRKAGTGEKRYRVRGWRISRNFQPDRLLVLQVSGRIRSTKQPVWIKGVPGKWAQFTQGKTTYGGPLENLELGQVHTPNQKGIAKALLRAKVPSLRVAKGGTYSQGDKKKKKKTPSVLIIRIKNAPGPLQVTVGLSQGGVVSGWRLTSDKDGSVRLNDPGFAGAVKLRVRAVHQGSRTSVREMGLREITLGKTGGQLDLVWGPGKLGEK